MKRIGEVKWFNPEKGFGFVVEDDGTEDYFLHYSSIQTNGFRTLEAGQRVVFTVVKTGRGLVARDVVPVADIAS